MEATYQQLLDQIRDVAKKENRQILLLTVLDEDIKIIMHGRGTIICDMLANFAEESIGKTFLEEGLIRANQL